MKFYSDGSGTNGISSSYCVLNQKGEVLKHQILEGEGTSNEMEYMGVIAALGLANKKDTVYSDSQLVVYQVTGKWKVKEPRLKKFADTAKALYKLKGASLQWISRDINLAGHYLEKHR